MTKKKTKYKQQTAILKKNHNIDQLRLSNRNDTKNEVNIVNRS